MYKKMEHPIGGTSNSSIVNCQLSIVNSRKAFTLVELLVVVAIIGILATLITVGAQGAIRSVKIGRIKMQMSQIEMAIEQYKAKYGEYPPDFSDEKAVLRHVKKRWPRLNLSQQDSSGNDIFPLPTGYSAPSTSAAEYVRFAHAIQCRAGWRTGGWGQTNDGFGGNGAGNYSDMTYLGSIPFWLGGLPDNANGGNRTAFQNNSTQYLIGFAANPENPFAVGTAADRLAGSIALEPPMMEFVLGKNMATFWTGRAGSGANPGWGYVPAVFLSNSPVLYFRANSEGGPRAYCCPSEGLRNLTNAGSGYAGYCKVAFHGQYYNTPGGTGGVDTRGFSHNFSGSYEGFFPGSVVPYVASNPTAGNVWHNAKTFQLIHPGLDGKFGRWTAHATKPYGEAGVTNVTNAPFVITSTGAGIGQFDLDNIVNFGEGSTLQANLP